MVAPSRGCRGWRQPAVASPPPQQPTQPAPKPDQKPEEKPGREPPPTYEEVGRRDRLEESSRSSWTRRRRCRVIGPDDSVLAVAVVRRSHARRARPERHADLRARRQRDEPRARRARSRPASSRCSTAAASTRTSSASSCGTSCRRTSTRSSRSKSSAGRRPPSGAPTRSTAWSTSSRRSPREMQGTTATLGFGGFSRPRRRSDGQRRRSCGSSMFYVSGTHAQAVNDRWAYQALGRRLHAGRVDAADRQHPERPCRRRRIRPIRTTGRRSRSSTCGWTTTSRRPAALQFAGGVAGHRRHHAHRASGRSTSTAARIARLLQGELHARARCSAQFFMNILNGDATNLLARGPTGQSVGLRLQDRDVRLRSRRRQTFAARARAHLRRQPPATTRST